MHFFKNRKKISLLKAPSFSGAGNAWQNQEIVNLTTAAFKIDSFLFDGIPSPDKDEYMLDMAIIIAKTDFKWVN